MKKHAKHVDKFAISRKDDVVIYHNAIGSELTQYIAEMNCIKIMKYHNITPAEYFKRYNNTLYNAARTGREDLTKFVGKFDYCWADSDYNKSELINIGYENVDVLPVFFPFDEYTDTLDQGDTAFRSDDYINIIFVGRIAPNKKQEDLIAAFYYYKTFVQEKSRLILVGSDRGFEGYKRRLSMLTEELMLKDVIFTGHISFNEVMSCYKSANVFLCMSEHEGFCVPLLESMLFKVPIIAFNSTAVPDTLGDAGILFNKKDYMLVAEIINELIVNDRLRSRVIEKQLSRLHDFSQSNIGESLIRKLETIIMSVGDRK